MRLQRLLVVVAAIALIAPVAGAQNLTTVYSNDFETSVGPEWSKDRRATTPAEYDDFLGRFGGEAVALDLYDLPEHCAVTVTLDLYIIGSWDGSVGPHAGPDIWDMNASTPTDCCPVENLIHTTFANCDCDFQAYPDNYPDVHLPGLTGAARVDTLGYGQDAVYELSYTFYHDEPDLRLSFAATPNLQVMSDESWGIDNIVVAIDRDSCCRATRMMPTTYGPGSRVPVEIEVAPSPGVDAWVLEEDPPGDFNIFAINDGGLVDDRTGVIKWGPFFGDQPRTLRYTVTMPLWLGGNPQPLNFNGVITVDGEPEAVCGDRTIVPGDVHPADMDGDFMISDDELTAYASAWRRGEAWPVEPSPVPSSLVTNAGLIWRAGEIYRYEPTSAPPWVPETGFTGKSGTVTSRLERHDGGAVTLTLEATPEAGTFAYVVEESVPDGWAVQGIEGDGRFDAATRTVRWGPFFDDAARELGYTLAATPLASPLDMLAGVAAFDGRAVAVTGTRMLSAASAERAPARAD